jgi:hypothetical protein
MTTYTLRELMAKATPAPWAFRPMGGNNPILIGEHGMRPIVLAASRKGMHGACLTARNFKLDIMQQAKADHPDVELIVAMRNELPAILDRLERLEEVAKAASSYVNRKGSMDDIGYHNGGYLLMQALDRLEKLA